MKENPLTNIDEDLQVSTRGAELQKESQARLAATQMDALFEAGSRSLNGGVGRVSAARQDVNDASGVDLDAQQRNIDMVSAQDAGMTSADKLSKSDKTIISQAQTRGNSKRQFRG